MTCASHFSGAVGAPVDSGGNRAQRSDSWEKGRIRHTPLGEYPLNAWGTPTARRAQKEMCGEPDTGEENTGGDYPTVIPTELLQSPSWVAEPSNCAAR